MKSRQAVTQGPEARRRIHAKLAARAARDSKGAAAAHLASLAAGPSAGGVAAGKAGAWHAADAHGDDSDGALRSISHDLAISEHDLAWALSQPTAHLEQHTRASRLLPEGVAGTDAGRPRSPTPDAAGSTGVGCEAPHKHDWPYLGSDANEPHSFQI